MNRVFLVDCLGSEYHYWSLMIHDVLPYIQYQPWYLFCWRTSDISCDICSVREQLICHHDTNYVREHLISVMIWISHINHDMLENILYICHDICVWEYLISAVIYQVCSVREHLIEVMIHFCKKTWYQPWYVFC